MRLYVALGWFLIFRQIFFLLFLWHLVTHGASIDALALRIASFDKQAIADTNHLVNIASLPPTPRLALVGMDLLRQWAAHKRRKK
jgi:hypothetical protein